jgi:hypothetical protein
MVPARCARRCECRDLAAAVEMLCCWQEAAAELELDMSACIDMNVEHNDTAYVGGRASRSRTYPGSSMVTYHLIGFEKDVFLYLFTGYA